MTFASSDPVLQNIGITSFIQHIFIIVGFQKCRMTLSKEVDQPFAGSADIGEYADIGFGSTHYKTVRIAGIMFFLKSSDTKWADGDGLLVVKMKYELPDLPKTRLF